MRCKPPQCSHDLTRTSREAHRQPESSTDASGVRSASVFAWMRLSASLPPYPRTCPSIAVVATLISQSESIRSQTAQSVKPAGVSRIGRRRQVIIPQVVLDELHLREGDLVEVTALGGRVS